MEHSNTFYEAVFAGIFASFILYSLFSRALGRTVITLPILFTAFGYLVSEPVALIGSPEQLDHGKRLLAEIALVLVLFSDASHIKFKKLETSVHLPMRMLAIGMPLTVLFGTATIYFIEPTGGLAIAFLAAAVLTPTDAALGQSVVTNPRVPSHLSQTINVESGLNDGLALPFVVVGALLCAGLIEHVTPGQIVWAAVTQVALAPVIGGGIGWLLAKGMGIAIDRDWIEGAAQGVVFLCAAFMAYLMSVCLGGNGFIAAFIGGMVFGNSYKHDTKFISEFMEGEGQILTMGSFLAFGALLVPEGLAHITWSTVLMALCMLTFVRMLPIWLSLSGTGLSAQEKLFLGWFGPRGLASLLFTMLVLEETTLVQETELMSGVTLTVLLSVFLHGLSALPFGNHMARYARKDG